MIALSHTQLELPNKKISKFIYLRVNLIFYVKKFTIALLSAIFVILIVSSVQSVATDSVESDIGIFYDEVNYNVELKDSKWQVYVQIMHRNEGNQLIGVIESSLAGRYFPHKITDHVFDTLMGEKEVVTIDGVKYEKVQYVHNPTHDERNCSHWPVFSDNPLPPLDYFCISHEKTHESNLEISNWRNYYCATFKEHDIIIDDKIFQRYDCLLIFQVLAPTITAEPHDILTQQWTIFRVLN